MANGKAKAFLLDTQDLRRPDPSIRRWQRAGSAARQGAAFRGLTGESDAAFEQLTDRCILDHGRRICPGEDRDAGTTGDADIAPGPPPERAVTWVPGVRSELDEHLALEDRIRERLDLSDAAGAVEDAQRLLAMAESARGASLLTALELYGDALTNAGQYNDAETQYLRALRLKLPESDAGGIERLVGSGTDLLLGKLANIYAMRGQLAQALKLSARALRLAGDGTLDPNGAWIFYNHARIATRAGTTNEAKQYFRRGAELFLAFYGEGSRDEPTVLMRSAVWRGRRMTGRRLWRSSVAQPK